MFAVSLKASLRLSLRTRCFLPGEAISYSPAGVGLTRIGLLEPFEKGLKIDIMDTISLHHSIP